MDMVSGSTMSTTLIIGSRKLTRQDSPIPSRPPDTRREQAVAAAAELFLKNGFDQTSLGDVIARTGGSRRDIYGFFGDKEGLFEAAMEHLVKTVLDEHVPQIIELDGKDIEADLTRLGRAFLKRMSDPVLLAVIHRFVSVAISRPHLGKRAFEAGPLAFQSRIGDYLALCNRRGDLELEDPYAAATIFSGMLNGAFQTRSLLTGETGLTAKGIERHVDIVVRLFLHGARS